MNSHQKKSPVRFRFFMSTGLVLGLFLALPIGSFAVGIAAGLCLSFLGGIVHRRSIELIA